MTFEQVCATARAFAAAHGLAFVTFTLLQYEALIDRAAHAAYVLTVAGGAVPADPDPFVESLAAAHDDLTGAFDCYITSKNWNFVYTAGGAATIVITNLDQQGSIDCGMMKITTSRLRLCFVPLLTQTPWQPINTLPTSIS